jgi:hypothetical protein
MNSTKRTSKILGIAFLLQFVTSFSSGVFIIPALIVSENIAENMIHIANNALLMRTNIFLDMLTALGIIFLGAMLFITLRKQNEKIALTALGIYILEAALLAASKLTAFSLLLISQEYVAAGSPYLETMANLVLESMDFVGNTLHMLAFCVGAILFYSLLDKSRLIPRALSLWGLITVSVCLVATIFVIFGFEVPFAIYVPYAPFELVVGIWILVKGINEAPDAE